MYVRMYVQMYLYVRVVCVTSGDASVYAYMHVRTNAALMMKESLCVRTYKCMCCMYKGCADDWGHCMYIYLCLCTNVILKRKYLRTPTHTCMHEPIYTHTQIYTCTRMHARTHKNIHIHAFAGVSQ